MKLFLKNPIAFLAAIFLVALGSAFAIGVVPQITPPPHWYADVTTIGSSVTWFGHTGMHYAAMPFLFFKTQYKALDIIVSFAATLIVASLFAGIISKYAHWGNVASFITAFGIIVSIGVADYCAPLFMTPNYSVTKNGILTEIWINQILNHLIPDGSYLKRSRDMAAYVAANVLHYAESGDLPEVQIDNTVFPVPFSPRSDKPLTINLHYFNTLGTVVRDAEARQLAYNKLEDVIAEHRRALYLQILKYITNMWFPQQNTEYTPVTATTGLIPNNANPYVSPSDAASLAFTPADFAAQKKKLDDLFVPEEGRVAVLCTQHMNDLSALDAVIFKAIQNMETGKTIKLYGFDVYTTAVPAIYNASTGQKLALGAVGDANNRPASLFYYENEMWQTLGDTQMFARLKDPQALGDIVNFAQFANGGSLRNKYLTAVYSATH